MKDTITVWLRQPFFREAVYELEETAKSAALQGVVAMQQEAVGGLQKQLSSEDERIAQQAAVHWLKISGVYKERGERGNEWDELLKTMGELRERLNQLERGRRDHPALTLS